MYQFLRSPKALLRRQCFFSLFAAFELCLVAPGLPHGFHFSFVLFLSGLEESGGGNSGRRPSLYCRENAGELPPAVEVGSAQFSTTECIFFFFSFRTLDLAH
uniref:Putative secreted protein n=1 Tax=Ixodes ricinus TaxID=34613 RepID=A0A6B0U728_IXORI